MKTNQTMRVTIGAYTQQIEHKTMMGNLNELWAYGNALRIAKGLGGLDMRDWMRSAQTHELLTAIEQKYNVVESHIIEKDSKGRVLSGIESPFIKTKRGKGGGTWVHLYLMLDAAAWLDAGFKVELYDTFIKGKLLEWRDESALCFSCMKFAVFHSPPSGLTFALRSIAHWINTPLLSFPSRPGK